MAIKLEKEDKFNLKDGPGLHALLNSLSRPPRLPHNVANSDEATAVQFSYEIGRTTRTFFAAIYSMEREDGSGERWNITGRVVFDCDFPFRKFCGYYDHAKRKGIMTIIKD
ncbi:MAG TPA: hypothetical protein VGE62_03340 [Candidatus Paceibacterota bacterium]